MEERRPMVEAWACSARRVRVGRLRPPMPTGSEGIPSLTTVPHNPRNQIYSVEARQKAGQLTLHAQQARETAELAMVEADRW